MDESELRQVALEVKGSLVAIVGGDEQLAARIAEAIDDALARPVGKAKPALRVILASDARVHKWVLARLRQVPQPVERLVPEFRGEEIRDGGEESRGPVEVGADGGPNASRRQEPAPAEPRPRYLRAQLPERVETGRPLSLVVAITLAPREGASGPLETFVVPPEGATVTILVSSPGLVPRGDMEQDIHVPADQDSKPHRFSFLAGAVGLHPVTVEAYRGGTHLGTVLLEVSVEADATVTEGPVRVAELTSVAFEPGEVTLQVNRGPNGYTFQLLGDPICLPVTGGVMGDAGTVVSQIVAELRDMAANRSKYASSQLVRDRLLSLGVELWAAAVPEAVQLQFWAQAERIRSFTIAADQDTIPWELLYPMNGTNDNGFLAEQFPVVRRAYAARRVTTLPMGSAAYVVPPKPPENALDEVAAIRDRLGIRVDNRGVLSELSAVRQLMLDSPGVLHLACHNTFTDAEGSSIKLGGGPWKPGDLSVAIQKTALAAARPLVFFNACRSAGETEWFSQMSGWAKNFVKAGAGAFIGSLWAVRSSSARTFAETFYEQFADNGEPLGSSSLHARRAIAEDGGDPTWLAYTVYGNPAAVAAR